MTPLSDTLRRLRRRIGDIHGDVYPDPTLQDALMDYLADTITPANGLSYAVIDSDGVPMIQPSPTGLETLLVLGTALTLLEGEAASTARDAVSMDGPSGRLNLQRPGELLADLLRDLRDEYENALLASDLFAATSVYLNMSEIESAFTEEATT